MRIILYTLFILLVFSKNIGAQKMTSNDSMLVKSYWNKISIKATGSMGDYLYSGIDNVLKISFPDEDSKKLTLFFGVNNGLLFKQNDGYNTIPRNPGRSFVTTYCISENKDTLIIGKKQFIVKAIPSPTLLIGKTFLCENCKIDRRVFITNDTLKIFFTDDYKESSQWVMITHFTVGYNYGGMYLSTSNEGPVLLPETLDFIKKLKPGQQMVIKITATTSTQVLKQMPIIRFFLL